MLVHAQFFTIVLDPPCNINSDRVHQFLMVGITQLDSVHAQMASQTVGFDVRAVFWCTRGEELRENKLSRKLHESQSSYILQIYVATHFVIL